MGETGSGGGGLGEYRGGGGGGERWEAGDDLGVRVLVKSLDGGLLEFVGCGAGGVELAEQGQGLAAHGLLDERQLAHLRCAERLAQPGGVGVDAAAAPGALEQRLELGEG